MPRTLFEHLSPDTGPKRILALDGGGVKGVLTLGHAEAAGGRTAPPRGRRAEFRLADYYDLIGGTSTGAIIASGWRLAIERR